MSDMRGKALGTGLWSIDCLCSCGETTTLYFYEGEEPFDRYICIGCFKWQPSGKKSEKSSS